MEKTIKGNQKRGKDISLLGLFGKGTFETLQKKMGDATDFSFSIIDYKGMEIVPGYYQSCYKKYLNKVGEDTATKMEAAFAAAKAAITNLPYIYLSQSGLVKVAIPIVVNEQYLGAIICGNVRCDDISYIDPDTGVSIINIDFPRLNQENEEDLIDFPVITANKIKIFANMIFYVIQEICQKQTYYVQLGNEEHNHIHLSDMRLKNRELKETIKKLEIKTMKSDLYPQTLLNMLVTLSNLAIVENAVKTQKIAGVFSSMLRYYVESDNEFFTLNTEFKMITDFLKVLQMQYENRIRTNIVCREDAGRQRLPKMILFPLVEYLIDFGILDRDFTGEIYGNAEMISGRCIISFRLQDKDNPSANNAYGNDSVKIMNEKGFHQQLSYVQKRLTLEYGEDFKLSLETDMFMLDIPGMLKD